MTWRLRVGDHRLRFQKQLMPSKATGGATGIVLVVTIGHRGDVYDR